jgi:hypothetical protein
MCNGLVHALTEQYDEINLICKRHYLETVKHLYEDFPQIKVLPVTNEFEDTGVYSAELKMPILMVGFSNCDYTAFEESFYKQLSLSPEYEYSKFKFPKRLETKLYESIVNKLGEEYIFIHDTCSAKKIELTIDSNLPRHYAEKDDTSDVLDYVKAMAEAKEVHVINSGINNLAFQMFLQGMLKGRIFYHNARKIEDGGIPVRVPRGIEVVNYG